jgi:creatinine amidohydrolase
MPEPRELMLADLTWTEVKELLLGIDMVLIPTGSIEQHGPGMALKTDIAIATGLCRLVSRKLYPRVLVAPPVPWGISIHHLNFPGTITLRPQVFIALLKNIVSSLMHHGFTRFMFVNAHGGNTGSLQIACTEIQDELKPTYVGFCYNFGLHKDLVPEDPEFIGHGCQIEASYGLYLTPEIVKYERIVPAQYSDFPEKLLRMERAWSIYSPAPVEQKLPLGFKGAPGIGTYERGKELSETVSDRIVQYIEALVEYQRSEQGGRENG